MKDVNLNVLKQSAIKLIIDDKEYKINFIPYIVEKEIYSSMKALTEKFSNIYNVSDDEWDRIKGWISQILGHKKNNNDFSDELFDNIGATELVLIMINLISFIAERINKMNDVFVTGDDEKKTAPVIE